MTLLLLVLRLLSPSWSDQANIPRADIPKLDQPDLINLPPALKKAVATFRSSVYPIIEVKHYARLVNGEEHRYLCRWHRQYGNQGARNECVQVV